MKETWSMHCRGSEQRLECVARWVQRLKCVAWWAQRPRSTPLLYHYPSKLHFPRSYPVLPTKDIVLQRSSLSPSRWPTLLVFPKHHGRAGTPRKVRDGRPWNRTVAKNFTANQCRGPGAGGRPLRHCEGRYCRAGSYATMNRLENWIADAHR